MKHKHFGKLACLALSLMIAGLAGCSNEQHIEAAAPETVNNVPVVTVDKVMVPDWLEAVGTVRAAQTSPRALLRRHERRRRDR